MSNKGIHANHRARMKQKFLENRSEAYYPHQLLEILLFFSIPRCDTNPIGHDLLERFRTIENVMSAEVDQLMEVNKIGPASAYFIRAVGEICRRYAKDRDKRLQFGSLADFKDYFVKNEPGYPDNSLVILSVNEQLELVGTEYFSLDNFTGDCSVSRIMIGSIIKGCTARIAVCLYHKLNLLMPDDRDYFLARMISNAATAIDTELIDLVVCDGDFAFSMRSSGSFSFVI